MCEDASIFASNAIWWVGEKGRPWIYFIDSAPKATPYDIGSKCPGGMADPGETKTEAARRETFEETGLVIKRRIRLVQVYDDQSNGSHHKFGFITPRSGCRGRIRQTPFEDRRSIIYRIYPIALDDAIDTVYQVKTKYHLKFLKGVRNHLHRKLGLPV